MKLRLENKESERVQELGNLIRAYNRSKREAQQVSLSISLSKMRTEI